MKTILYHNTKIEEYDNAVTYYKNFELFKIIALFLFLLNILDGMLTLIGIKFYNMIELNFILSYFFDKYGLLFTLIVNFYISFLMLYLLIFAYERANKKYLGIYTLCTLIILEIRIILLYVNVYYIYSML